MNGSQQMDLASDKAHSSANPEKPASGRPKRKVSEHLAQVTAAMATHRSDYQLLKTYSVKDFRHWLENDIGFDVRITKAAYDQDRIKVVRDDRSSVAAVADTEAYCTRLFADT